MFKISVQLPIRTVASGPWRRRQERDAFQPTQPPSLLRGLTLVRRRQTRTARIMVAPFSADSLPSTLGIGLQPWIAAIETATVGMGERASAVAANASTGIRRRIVPTPLLDHAFAQARLATDAFAVAVDEQRADATRLRADAMAALGELIMWLQEAKANTVTEELGLGW